MPYVSKEQLAKARELDLLSYLERYDPDELVPMGNGVYCTKTHDSLKISNGKWSWWSRHMGGSSALDYLVAVQGMSLPDAVIVISGTAAEPHRENRAGRKTGGTAKPPSAFARPAPHIDDRRVFAYLCNRGIHPEIVRYCVKHGLLYEEAEHHNAVFMGFDPGGAARYATMRSTLSDSTFLRDADGSDKRYCFSLSQTAGESSAVFVFEGAIDALSRATLDRQEGVDWRGRTYLSLGGISKRPEWRAPELPPALAQHLADCPKTRHIVLCLDNDEVGREAAAMIMGLLDGYDVSNEPPKQGKDYNEYLQIQKDITGRVKTRGHVPPERGR